MSPNLTDRLREVVSPTLWLSEQDVVEFWNKRWHLDAEFQAALVPQALLFVVNRGANLQTVERDMFREIIAFVDVAGTSPAANLGVAALNTEEARVLNDAQSQYAGLMNPACKKYIGEMLGTLRPLWGKRLFLEDEFERAMRYWMK